MTKGNERRTINMARTKEPINGIKDQERRIRILLKVSRHEKVIREGDGQGMSEESGMGVTEMQRILPVE